MLIYSSLMVVRFYAYSTALLLSGPQKLLSRKQERTTALLRSTDTAAPVKIVHGHNCFTRPMTRSLQKGRVAEGYGGVGEGKQGKDGKKR